MTLSLQVTGVRADGYHLLDAEMVTVDLADTLSFGPGSGVSVVDEVPGGLGLRGLDGGPGNLVGRALEAVGRHAAVRLVKRIPVGAGLGGGSADAAAVLRWAGCHERDVAARLGADVPFCVVGGRARVRGIGDVVEPLPFQARRFVLLLVPVAMDTAQVYRAWDAMHAPGERAQTPTAPPVATAPAVPRGVVSVPVVAEPSGAGSETSGIAHQGSGNALEAAAITVEPQLARWRDALGNATGQRPRLAGSGSTWFVEGDPATLGIEDRPFLVLQGLRAPLVAVRTVPPATA